MLGSGFFKLDLFQPLGLLPQFAFSRGKLVEVQDVREDIGLLSASQPIRLVLRHRFPDALEQIADR